MEGGGWWWWGGGGAPVCTQQVAVRAAAVYLSFLLVPDVIAIGAIETTEGPFPARRHVGPGWNLSGRGLEGRRDG